MKPFALSAGLDYTGTGNDLTACAKDARGWVPVFGSRLLLNKDATRNELMGQVNETVRLPGANEWAVITFSGHGTQVRDKNRDEPDGWDEALVSAELDLIVDDEFQSMLKGRNRKAKILVISDSCFSGTIHRAAPMLSGAHNAEIRKRRLRYMPLSRTKPKARRAVNEGPQAALPNVVLISGCADFEYSYERNDGSNGVLTGALLETYDPKLTIAQWYKAACKLIENSEYKGMQHPQLTASITAKRWRVPSL